MQEELNSLLESLQAYINAEREERESGQDEGIYEEQDYTELDALEKRLQQFQARAKLFPEMGAIFSETLLNGRTFTGIETEAVKITDEETEVCEEKDANAFSVYFRFKAGHVECIADFPTKQQAKGLVILLQYVADNYKPNN